MRQMVNFESFRQQEIQAATKMFDKEIKFIKKAEELGLTITTTLSDYDISGEKEKIDEFLSFMRGLV